MRLRISSWKTDNVDKPKGRCRNDYRKDLANEERIRIWLCESF
jgi:hypothetical protein